jgi:hypothetical protein
MDKSHHNPSSMLVTTADLSALKAEIVEAVQNTIKGLATRETVDAVMETVAETKEGMTALTGLMQERLGELTAMHEDGSPGVIAGKFTVGVFGRRSSPVPV